MDFLPQWLNLDSLFSIGAGAFVSGVALLYLVIQRTRKHRSKEQEAE